MMDLEKFREEFRRVVSGIYCGDNAEKERATEFASIRERFYIMLQSRIAEVPGELVLVVRRDEARSVDGHSFVCPSGFISELLLGVLAGDGMLRLGREKDVCRFPTTRYVRSKRMFVNGLTTHRDPIDVTLFPAFWLSSGKNQNALDCCIGNQEVRAWFTAIAGYSPFLFDGMLKRLGYAFDLAPSQYRSERLSPLFV